MSEKIVVDKLAFETTEIKGHRICAWYLKEPKADALVKIMKGDDVVQEFLYAGYKIWNLSAHADEIIESLLAQNDEGLRHAGSDGLGGGVMPRPVTE